MENLKLPELTQGVLAKLEELKYSKGTLNGHRCVYSDRCIHGGTRF